MNPKTQTLPLSLVLAWTVACGAESVDIEVDTTRSDAVVAMNKRWPTTDIPVCWINPSAATATDRQTIRDAAFDTYRYTRVRFTGWGACSYTPTRQEVRIKIRPGRSRAKVGPTMDLESMWLDIAAEQNRLPFLAAHEFGHAIGMQHEQNRPYSPCRLEPEPMSSGDWALGPYDSKSLMNYCTPNHIMNAAELSDIDRLGIKAMYGANGNFVHMNGTVYRERDNAATCIVRDPLQLEAFGGAAVGVHDATIYTVSPQFCVWPDGFYRLPNGEVYFMLGDEDPFAPDTYCWVESPTQLAAFGGLPLDVPDNDIFRGRTDLGRCRWPEGYYKYGSSTYLAQDTTFCFIQDEEIYTLQAENQVLVPPTSASWHWDRTYTGACNIGPWDVHNPGAGDFPLWAAQPGVKAVSGRFDANGTTDVALVGGPGWTSVPVALSNGNATYDIKNERIDQQPDPNLNFFAVWAQHTGVRAVVGNFDGDANNLSDIALVGGVGWTSIPIAHSLGNGRFRVTNCPINQQTQAHLNDFGLWASHTGVQVVAGDFDADGDDDVALVGGQGWATIPVAFSNRNGCFRVTNEGLNDPAMQTFAGWASAPGVKVVAGRFGANDLQYYLGWHAGRKSSIALIGGPGWTSLPVATGSSTGVFTTTNEAFDAEMSAQASGSSVLTAVGDVNGDGRDDIVLANSGPGWRTIPVLFATSPTQFAVSNDPAPYLRAWIQEPVAKLLVGDANADGRADILLTGGNGWTSLPVAFRR